MEDKLPFIALGIAAVAVVFGLVTTARSGYFSDLFAKRAKAEATVTSVALHTRSWADIPEGRDPWTGANSDIAMKATFRYTFMAEDGQTFEGSDVYYNPMNSSGLRTYVETHPVGTTVTVTYQTDDPTKSHLFPNPTWIPLVGLVGILGILAALWFAGRL
ncbi:DUF3592 domain-containing protein [Candidatus Uhrbacteria bacterium]|nr:DUF3592 domain-containing protein [Candidatus Uhrbacteria bacterium]